MKSGTNGDGFVDPVSLVHELANVAASLPTARAWCDLSLKTRRGLSWPVFAGAVGSSTLAALALACDVSEISNVMGRALDPGGNGYRAPNPVPVAAWQQNSDYRRGGGSKPLYQSRLMDCTMAEPFITGGITITKDPA